MMIDYFYVLIHNYYTTTHSYNSPPCLNANMPSTQLHTVTALLPVWMPTCLQHNSTTLRESRNRWINKLSSKLDCTYQYKTGHLATEGPSSAVRPTAEEGLRGRNVLFSFDIRICRTLCNPIALYVSMCVGRGVNYVLIANSCRALRC